MGVLCSKPSTDGIAANRETPRGNALRLNELRRDPPKTLVAPPRGVLDVLFQQNIDGKPFATTHYARAWTVLQSSGSYMPHATYQVLVNASVKSLSDFVTGAAGGPSPRSTSLSPAAAETGTHASYASGGDTTSPVGRQQQSTLSFEELVYKLMSPGTSANDDDDDDTQAMSDLEIVNDEDQFEFGSGGGGGIAGRNSGRQNITATASLLHPTYFSEGAGGNGRKRAQARRRGSSSSSALFGSDGILAEQLTSALLNQSVNLDAEFPAYFCGAQQPSRQKRASSTAEPVLSESPIPGFLNNARLRTTSEPDGFVSFEERCRMASAPSREAYFNAICDASHAVSALLMPLAMHVSVALGRFIVKRKTNGGGAGPRGGAPLRRRTSNMSSDREEPDTPEECVRMSLRAFWRNNNVFAPAVRAAIAAGALSSNGNASDDAAAVVRLLASRQLKYLFLVGGGWASIGADDRRLDSNEDLLLADALQVEAVNMLVGPLTRAAGFDGTNGMHTHEETEQWALCLRELFASLGLVPRSMGGAAAAPSTWWPTMMRQFPHFVLGDDGKQTLIYIHCALLGQKKLPLQPVMRADALRSIAKRIEEASVPNAKVASSSLTGSGDRAGNTYDDSDDDADALPSYRLFPVFATEGVGLESGEGHGPRKELFDLSAIDVTAPRSLPIDITSAATFQLVSSAREVQPTRIATGTTIGGQFLGKPVLIISWKQRRMIGAFQQGDVLTITLERRGGAAVSSGSSVALWDVDASSSSIRGGGGGSSSVVEPLALAQQNECWSVEGALEATNVHESLVVLSNTNARIPIGYRVVSAKVEQKRNPPFAHESGNTYAWLNPSFLASARAAAQKKKSRSSNHGGADFDTLSPQLIMFTVGWVLANAVPNGLVAPCALPPFVFRFVRHTMLACTTRREQLNLLDASADCGNGNPAYQVCASDLVLVNASLLMSIEETLKMGDVAFMQLLEADGLDPATTSRSAYVESVLLQDTLWNSGDADASRNAMNHLALGFASSPLSWSCPIVTYASCSKQCRNIFCGPIDEGTTEFSFLEHFRVLEDAELTQFDYSVVFRDILWDVLENGFPTVAGKRQLLKFITGRTLLPPRKKAEHIKLEFPMTPMNAREFEKALSRLPSSHSCDNVLELVNVLECLLFQPTSPFYALTGRRPGGVVLDDQKELVWQTLSHTDRVRLKREAKKILQDKLRQAVMLSGTYELDDAAVSRATREAYEATHAGPTVASTSVSYNGGGPIDVSGASPHVDYGGTSTPKRGSLAQFNVNDVVSPSGSGYHQHTATPNAQSIPGPARKISVAQKALSHFEEFDDPEEPLHPATMTSSGNHHVHAMRSAVSPPLHGVVAASDSSGVLFGHHSVRASSSSVKASAGGAGLVGSIGPHGGGGANVMHTSGSLQPPGSLSVSRHSHHLSIFERHNIGPAGGGVVDDIDDDDVVQLAEDSTPPQHRGGGAASTMSHRGGHDIDNLMTELFPGKKK